MNFFGHALVAQRAELARGRLRAEFVLGSMLPDFASILRSKAPPVSLEALQTGVAFHHQTDDAFHGCAAFREFSQQANDFLSRRGLARGAARAVAHVGVELVLDAAFAREEAANEAYLSALDCALSEPIANHIHWQSAARRAHFEHLCHTLRERGAFAEHTSAERIAESLRHILSDRPRLAMDDAGQSVVRDWVMTARPWIVSRAPLLLREVERRLQHKKT